MRLPRCWLCWLPPGSSPSPSNWLASLPAPSKSPTWRRPKPSSSSSKSSTITTTCRASRPTTASRTNPWRNWDRNVGVSQRLQERHQVLLFWRGQLQPQHQVEKLHAVIQRQQPVVMQVWRRVLDAAQGEGLDRAVGRSLAAVDHPLLEEPLHPQVVHQVVRVVRRWMASPALRLAEKQLLPAQLALGRLGLVQLAQQVQLRHRWKIEQILELSHEVHLAAA